MKAIRTKYKIWALTLSVKCRRSDIFIKSPSIFDPAVIIELKVCDNPKDIFKICDEALEQIQEKKYEEELKQEGYENIIKHKFNKGLF